LIGYRGDIAQGLFATITNANWDDARFSAMITDGLQRRDQIRSRILAAYKEKSGNDFSEALPESATWTADPSAFAEKAKSVGVLATANEDVRSLR
jgi:hydroxylamine reductase